MLVSKQARPKLALFLSHLSLGLELVGMTREEDVTLVKKLRVRLFGLYYFIEQKTTINLFNTIHL